MRQNNMNQFIGIDLGDKTHQICILDEEGQIKREKSLRNNRNTLWKYFGKMNPSRIALESGTHSMWMSKLLKDLGHEVFIGNPRRLRMIYTQDFKSDKRDARMLARIVRLDPELLSPVRMRNQETHADLAVITARDELVETRTKLINYVRSVIKVHGGRIRKCTAPTFHKAAADIIPDLLKKALDPLIVTIAMLTQQIRDYEYQIANLSKEKYPEAEYLQTVNGVGPLTSLAFILTLEEPERFTSSRDVGPYLGLVPRRDQSGDTDRRLGVTKSGNKFLRKLLIQCANYIVGPFGKDSELRRFGLKILGNGGKYAKKRAATAVARKLAVLMHRLWSTGEVYDPFYNERNLKAAYK